MVGVVVDLGGLGTSRESDNLLVGDITTVSNSGRQVSGLGQAAVRVAVDQVTTVEVLPGIALAARVAAHELALDIREALAGAQQAVDVAFVADNPSLAVRSIAVLPRNLSRLVVSKTSERLGVEDQAGGEHNGVAGAAHATGNAVNKSVVGGNVLSGDTTSADLDLLGLTSPQILDIESSVGVDAISLDTHGGPRNSVVGSLASLVENGENAVAVGQVLGENVTVMGGADHGGLLHNGVLIDSDEVLVEEDLKLLRLQVRDVSTDNKRGREGRPQRHVGSLLLESVVAVVGVEEIRVVDEVGALEASKTNVLVVVRQQAVPSVPVGFVVDNVIGVTGELAHLLRPAHDAVPVCQIVLTAEVSGSRVGEDDWLGELEEKLAPNVKVKMAVVRLGPARNIAAVQLEVLVAPVGKVLQINGLVIESSRVPTAGEGAGVRVDTGDKPLLLDEACEPGQTFGELGGVDKHGTVGGALHRGPGIVEVQTIVAGRQHAVSSHGIGSISEDGLVDVGSESRPVVEAHGRKGQVNFRGASRAYEANG